ncbi:MAG: CoA-acylating methylmalonate-semialdehyde dehydrogenase [Phycisphaerae bacterium]
MRNVRNYINGQWAEPTGVKWLDVENPSTGAVIGRTPLCGREQVDQAIQAAEQAYAEWSRTPVARRVQPIFQLVRLLREDEEELARSISEENGKSLADARAEMKRAFENCEVACGMPVLQQSDKLVGASYGIDGEILRLPIGIFAMIAPFNFPGMVPFWFMPYAIAAGNTYIVKPSEQTPLTFQRVAELIDQTDLPAGVFNLVNGDKEAAAALVDHPRIAGISLVGNSRTCRTVAERCAAQNKRCQAMGSAKNHLVVMPDAKLDEAVRNMVTSCYGCAGQRCMASSAIVAVGDETYRTVCERFIAASKEVVIADPLDPAVADESMVLGPVISARAKEFIHQMIETGINEGATPALDGRDAKVPGCENGHFVGPTVFTEVRPGMEIHQTEIFGPVVIILKVHSLDEAIQIINDHQYGNGASIYTQSGYWARRFKLETRCGMIGVNVGIPAPVAYLPFGGMKDSQHADIKAQGKAVIGFFTEPKIVTERYWPEE